ncbi:LOB domain-containing protein 36-like [Pyrus ussuriensis x Pyrus communis]|uniref:LOB domain-containing protein 36-like n=1 Tax=Pyrus ussuriensis x Pyrus communis TaxID=2448454 RepID=A0A5N5H447_9ROSA|nr:LOB domain-containing protein 36-like [Pyrus x bretschneideri]XP_048427275.1 LOB domain-containing protein 36-like [Pyrus x bretschneideri]XP_048427276.1 LOB domain-containing protein 36-like [Pyrus x bretschneideri]KAB2617894.1 LOB domain-containing protein 36-like [Pyrus ussuriensis x Pyrus communis]
MSSSSNSPCAACKFLRRKCTQECVFAPYFPPDNPHKFSKVHKVFGASNVAKILNELSASQRDDAVNSLAYEAEARLRDPVYGCVGLISILQQRLKEVQADLFNAKKELATYMGPQAMLSILQPPTYMAQQLQGNAFSAVSPYMSPMIGIPTGAASGQLMIREPQQQQIFEAQQLAVAVAAREQQAQDHVRFNSGFDSSPGSVTVGGFTQMAGALGNAVSPSLALGFDSGPYHQIQQQQPHHNPHLHLQLQSQLLLQTQLPQGQHQAQQSQQPQLQAKSDPGEEGGGRSVGPSC